MPDKFETFLEEYCTNHPDALEDHQPLPIRLMIRSIAENDLQGECIDLCLQYLKTLHCPDLLNLALTHNTTSRVLNGDLSSHFKESSVENSDIHYEGAGIAHKVLSQLHAVCHEWNSHIPSFLCNPEEPPMFSECGIKNTRRKMEDRHNVFTNLNLLLDLKDMATVQFYAVFDGHGGLDASYYAAKQLHLKLCNIENFTGNFSDSLKAAIKLTDDDFCSKAKNERIRSGTTAVVSVIYENTLHLAWVGDSQAVLVRNGKALDIINPHKPEREDEKLRIEEMGGCVVWFGAWRVNGSLAVSRAIGDADHKPYVCGDADTTTMALDGSEDFLCLACDGFWDVYTGNDLVNLVREYLKDANNDRRAIAQHLCARAKEGGSTDNISVVFVYLKEDVQLPEPEAEPSDTVATDLQHEEAKVGDAGDGQSPNINSNNNNNHVVTSVNSPKGDDSTGALDVVKGSRVQPEPKARVPHKLLVNFVKKLHQKEVDKDPTIVLNSSHHAKLPHTLTKPRWSSPNISPKLARSETKESILSLSTVTSTITELTPGHRSKTKRSTSELPRIEDVDPTLNAQPQRHSIGIPHSFQEKKLGHRAVRRRGRPRVSYAPSLVSYQSAKEIYPQPLRKLQYSQSIPGDLNLSSDSNVTDIAITNSLATTLRPLKDRRHAPTGQKSSKRSVVMLVNRGRQRSRSAF